VRSRLPARSAGTKWQPIMSLEQGAGAMEGPADAVPSAGRLEQLALGAELTRTLDRHEMSRSVMPALALLERALRAASGRGEARLAAPVLWDALNHLNVLADSWQGTGLRALQHRLSAVLGLDEADVDVLCATDHSFQVADARMSDFMQVMEEWKHGGDCSGEEGLVDPVTH